MPRVQLRIADAANRLTVRTMLQAGGHLVVDDRPEVVLTDDVRRAPDFAREAPTLVLVPASQVPLAVDAMRRGVYGYVLLPFQPGEAELMVRRAVHAPRLDGAPSSDASAQPETLAEVEARHIRATLRFCKNNRAKAARLLGIGRNTLWRKLKARRKAESLE